MRYATLFEPIQIGRTTIVNRFVMPAMESGTTKEHLFTEQSKSYFMARAKGGFGLIITDYTAVSPEGIGVKDEIGLWDDCFIENLKSLTDEIHKTDAKIFAQLHHSGMMCVEKTTGVPPKGPSAIASPNYKEKVSAYTKEEVRRFVEKYGDAAARAKKAGYDGVEVHGAHGYQIAQFLSPFSNKRCDEYGGSYENRFRFAKEILENIRKKCGLEYPILFRISAEEFIESGCTIQDAMIYVQMAEKAGADAISVSTGTGIGGNIVTPHYFQPGFNVSNAEAVKKVVDIPVITVGRINEPALACAIIDNKRADMVALGRQSICDSEFPNKVREGREDEIFHCTGCMQRCYYAPGCEEDDTGVSCIINPFSGKENRWRIEQANDKKKIAIIGAGPAGLEAAWILAKRGHIVDVYEKNQEIGGNFRLASVPPKKQDLAHTIYTYERLCKKYRVKIHTNFEMTEEKITALGADVVILATGAEPVRPELSGISESDVIAAVDVLSGEELICDRKVLILGGGLVGCETAEFLHIYQNEVTIVDMADELAKESVKRSKAVLMENLKKHHTKVYLNTKMKQVKKDGIIGEKDGTEIVLDGFDQIILALGFRSYNPLEECTKNQCSEVHVIGDAKRARDAKFAIYEAAKLAISI